MINFELLTQARASILKRSTQVFNREIWKEKVLIDKINLPKNIYRWNHNSLTKLLFR